MQPPGYIHSLGFLDPARYVRYQLRRLGMEVSIGKNRLREDAVNLVFGAHLGFNPALRERYAYLICNLEQIGPGGAHLSEEYLRLLKSSAVVDYEAQNVLHYCEDVQNVPLLSFYSAPYLKAENLLALEDRPIDLLFFGSLNERRQAFIQKVEACGLEVSVFDRPLYGPERDAYIRQAKAVLNGHFYETSRFEQIRASHCLSLGTPVISERSTHAPKGFDEAIFWLDERQFTEFFGTIFKSESFYSQAREKIQTFSTIDPIEAYADLVGFAAGFVKGYSRDRELSPWKPEKINLGSGKDYRLGWLNIDVLDKAEPDLVLDLGQPVDWPVQTSTRFGADLELERGSVDTIYANNVLEHVPDLVTLMSNALTLLKEGGTFEIEVPYEKSLTAWQDPTHLRALNENSWVYYTDWFWYLGWFEHRFEMADSSWLNLQLQPCAKEEAAFMRVVLRKVATSDQERNLARVMQPNFGGLDHDVPADEDILFSFEDEPDESPAGITEAPHEMVLKHAVATPLPGVNGRSRFCRGSSQCPATP